MFEIFKGLPRPTVSKISGANLMMSSLKYVLNLTFVTFTLSPTGCGIHIYSALKILTLLLVATLRSPKMLSRHWPNISRWYYTNFVFAQPQFGPSRGHFAKYVRKIIKPTLVKFHNFELHAASSDGNILLISTFLKSSYVIFILRF